MNLMVTGVLWSLMGIALMIIIVLIVTRLKGNPIKKKIIQKEMLQIVAIWALFMVIFITLQ